jgi:F-type H+-transporting ATPase subunit alpha
MAAAFQLAWMIAFNEGLLDACEPQTLPDTLQKILAGLEREPLLLDAVREEWLARLRNWLGVTP